MRRTRPRPAPPVPIDAVARAGATLGVPAGLLRIGTSFVSATDPTAALLAVYFLIDLGILFTVAAVIVMERSSRTRLGLVGATLSGVGAATLLAPDSGGDDVRWYVASAAVLIGFAMLAVAWTRAGVFPTSTRSGLILAACLGAVAAATENTAAQAIAGVVFGLAITSLALQLRITSLERGASTKGAFVSETPEQQILLPGQHAAPPGPVDLQMMYVMHHAFRRDMTAVIDAVATADIGDRERWAALDRRWELFVTVLHHHHEAEDTGLWPVLLDRVKGDDTLDVHDARQVLEDMAAEHALIDPALATCTEAFAALARAADETTRTALRGSLDELRRLLERHLAHEEGDAMALVQRHLAPAEWQRIEEEHFKPAYSLRDLVSVVPWAVWGLSPDVRRKVLADAGQPMGVLWHATRRAFARSDARAFRLRRVGPIDTRSTVAVVGATGTVGGLVVDELVDRHADVRVLVRSIRPEGTFAPGVTQVLADLHDEAGLRAALEGVRAALYVSPHDPDEEALASNFIRAAEATGTRLVFAGLHLSPRTAAGWLTRAFLPAYRGKLRIGRRIAASHTDPVIFSPTNFFQNDEIFEADLRGGRFPMPMRNANRIDVRDVAELCAQALLIPGYPPGEHVVAGPASLTGEECAEVWAQALGRKVDYVGDDEHVWIPIFEHRLRGQKLIDVINTSRFLGRRDVILPHAVAATTALLGRDPRNYGEYVAERVDHTTAEQPGQSRDDERASA